MGSNPAGRAILEFDVAVDHAIQILVGRVRNRYQLPAGLHLEFAHGDAVECAACGGRIKDTEVEHELELAGLMRLHSVRLLRTGCDVWNAERVTFNVVSGVSPYRTERPQ